ncbi:MAG: 50S ribosomal protein L1 [Patescibacteria group bacterium]|nr:50S ribosomal protein L1 [Patescibacteria group bacterium]
MAKNTFGKNYRNKAELIDANKAYSLADAAALAVQIAPAKFDETVELHVSLGIDITKADQMLRSTITLPEGTGKTLRVVAFVEEDKAADAIAAGAIKAGSDELIAEVANGFTDFDVAIATPTMMKQLGKIARVLGPKGLMPNPKAGTVSPDPIKAVTESLGGKVEYRADKFGITHNGIGKVSFGGDRILANAKTLMDAIVTNKPSGSKGTYIKSITLTTTMGPSISIDTKEFTKQ